MDSQTWANVIAACNLIIATTAVICALAAPRISARLTMSAELERTKRQEKLWVFAQLMQNRATAESLEFVRALNMIDIIYHDQKEVRRLWREYHDMISNVKFIDDGVGWELIKQKRSALLLAMARDLKYEVESLDVDRIYAPRWQVENEEIAFAERKLKLTAARQLPQPPPKANGGGGRAAPG